MKQKNKQLLFFSILIFIISRLIQLNFLPIFADEAIYLRWAQMIYHDPQQFLFLPLYDGKTPLFIWLLIPITRIFTANPLLGGRLLTVTFSFITAVTLVKIVKLITKTSRTIYFTLGIYTLLPFTFFFDRLSLIDTALTTFLAVSFLFSLYWLKKPTWKNAILTGIWWGMAVVTKNSALYTIPIFGFVLLTAAYRDKTSRLKRIIQWVISAGFGLSFLLGLKVSPLFPFLFRRSSDFAYSIQDIVSKPLEIISINLPKISLWLWSYLNPVAVIIVIATIVTLAVQQKKSALKTIIFFIICMFLYVLPFLLTGKLLTSRYLLPLVIWFIPAVVLAIDFLWRTSNKIALVGIVFFIMYSLRFVLPLYANLEKTWLTSDDKQQYLAEWSAGFGLPEIREYLADRVNLGNRVMVVTEGYFGTLPDGLFIQFSETSLLANMEIFGIGQPIFGIPDTVKAKQPSYNETYLVVNQNRLKMNYETCCELVAKYPKPYQGSPLLLLKIKP